MRISFKNGFQELGKHSFPLRFKDAWGFSKTFVKEKEQLIKDTNLELAP